MRGVERAGRPVSLVLVLACTCGTMILGSALKGPCATGSWSDGRQYRLLCYSDIVPLLNTEQLTGNRLPFFQPCLETGGQCDEYPVLTMYFMRVAAWIGGSTTAGFFTANAVLLWVCAAAIATFLYMLGGKALWFALAPTLLIYGFMNWDLFAVAFATGALVAFARRRDGLTGVLLGLGAAAKFYPAMLVIPLIAQRLHDREPDARDQDRLGDRRDLAAREPAVRDRVPVELVDVLPVQLGSSRRIGTASGSSDARTSISSAICGHTSRINVASFALVRLDVRAGVDVETASRAGLRAVEPRVPDARAVPARPTRSTRRSTDCGCCRSSRSARSTCRRSSPSRRPTSRCS